MFSSSSWPRLPAKGGRCGALWALLLALACAPSTVPAPVAASAAPAISAAVLAPFDAARLTRPQSPIRVEGNHFLNEAGATVVFQGVNIEDPDDLERYGHWNRGLFEAIAARNANVVRRPVHPPRFRRRGAEHYFELLDQAVLWANELGLYVILDWHSIGNLLKGKFQEAQYDTSEQETLQFWRSAASRYQKVPTVALYELFNEPTFGPKGRLGSSSWSDWKRFNEQLIDVIREHNPAAIALVAGFDWAYDLQPVAEAPIARPSVAYVAHPYPGKTRPPYAAK